ncbi:hypothetical protein ES703_25048 [subsurface metagenome]|nr:glycosyltransferase [Dehalococcoidia bacterium]
MRILIISQYYPPDITAAAFRTGDTVHLLSEMGHEITVLSALPHKGHVKGQEQKACDQPGVRVFKRRIFALSSGGFFRYILQYICFAIVAIWEGLRLTISGWRPDVIWATSPPLTVGLSGWFLSIIMKRPLVLDIRDIWPESAVAAGQLSNDSLAFYISKKLESFLYSRSSHITCVSKPMRAYLVEMCKSAVTVVYNGVPAKFDTEINWGRKYQNTITYVGNLGLLQAVDVLIQGFADLYLSGELKGWLIKVIGTGVQETEIIELTEKLGIAEHVTFVPPLPRQVALEELSRSALLYLNLKSNMILEHTIPSKVFDYLLAGRPIIAGILGEGKEILESTGANVCYEPSNISDFKISLKWAIANLSNLDEKAFRNRDIVLEQYTREKAVEQLLMTFQGVLEK